MSAITPIYSNESGIAFYWNYSEHQKSTKVQLIFRDTGFYFTNQELEEFKAFITQTCEKTNSCASCINRKKCEKFLLKTPVSQIDLAVNFQELEGIQDLVCGTLFKLELIRFVNNCGRN